MKIRGTVSNVIMVLETLDSIFNKDPLLGSNSKFVALKLDMMKIYDRVS